MKFSTLFLVLAAVFYLLPAHAAGDAKCDDSTKVYKICSDQETSYKTQLAKAKEQSKMLVVVLGAEWCPWCLSLHKMLNDPAFGGEFAKKYVLADVGVYNGKAKLPSGEAVLKLLQTQAHDLKKIDGIPVLAMVNPQSEKTVLINTEPLEKNTKTTKGHDSGKVLAALEAAAGTVH